MSIKNSGKKLRSIVYNIKKVGWLIFAEVLIIIFISLNIFSRTLCIGSDDFTRNSCEKTGNFLEKLQFDYGSISEGIIIFGLSLLLIIIICSIITAQLFVWMKNFKQWNINKKIFSVEICILVLALFTIVLMSMYQYDGTSCLANDCVTISLFFYTLGWVLLSILSFLDYPQILLIFIFPYILFYFSRKK